MDYRFAVVLAVWLLASLALAARLLVRRRLAPRDGLVLLAYLSTTGLSAAVLATQRLARPTTKPAIYAFSVLYNPSLALIQSCVLLAYLQRISRRPLRHAVYAVLALANAAALAMFLLNVCRCRPVRYGFSTPAGEGKCLSFVDLYLASVPLNLVIDCAILVLPLSALDELDMPVSRKSGLRWIFAGGAVVTAVTVVRTAMLQCAYAAQMASQRPSLEDRFPWHAEDALMWSAVEVNVGVIVLCAPAILHVFKKDPKEKRPQRLSTADSLDDAPGKGQGRPQKDKRTSMLDLSNKQALPFLCAITFLLFLWGFAHGLLNTVNFHFLIEAKNSYANVSGLHAAYFAGFVLGAPLAALLLKRHTFKLTFIVGLCIYALGVLISWTSAVVTSFPTYVFSNIVTGTGMAVVQASSHSFLALCGPAQHAERRLNIALGFQSIGTAISSILARRAFANREIDSRDLVQMKWAYFAMALVHIVLAIGMHYLSLPEADDNQLAALARQRQSANSAKVHDVRVVWITLAIAVLSQFLYTGGAEGINVHFRKLARHTRSKREQFTSFESQTLGFALFAIGRFLTVALQYLAKPRVILLFLYVGLVASCVVCVLLRSRFSMLGALFTYLFSSGIYGLTFAIALRGMGHHTRTAAALLTAAVSGGGVFTSVQRAVVKRDVFLSFAVPATLFGVALLFPIYLNAFPPARRHVDPTLRSVRSRSRTRSTGNISKISSGGIGIGMGYKASRRGEGVESIFPSQETIARVVQRAHDRSSLTEPAPSVAAAGKKRGSRALRVSLSSWGTTRESTAGHGQGHAKWPSSSSSEQPLELELDRVGRGKY